MFTLTPIRVYALNPILITSLKIISNANWIYVMECTVCPE